MSVRVPIFAYHALIADREAELPALCSREHAVSLELFRAQLDILVAGGFHAVLPEALQADALPSKPVLITFDDGHASDMLAASELRRRGLVATFFITCSRLGNPGFLDRGQLVELSREGFAIGSHGVDHLRLADLAPEGMQDELAISRQELERVTGRPVTTLAVPFGSWDARVIASAMAAGYRAVMTSDFGLAVAGNRVLPRLEVTSRTTLREFEGLLSAIELGGTIDLSQPVCVLFVSMLHFMAGGEADALVAAFRDRMAPGSYLVISAGCMDEGNVPAADDVQSAYGSGTVLNGRTPTEIAAYFGDFELVPPGIVPVTEWPLAVPDAPASRLPWQVPPAPEKARMLAGIGRKRH